MPGKTLKEVREEHWVVILAITFGAGAAISWAVLNEVLVKPRDYDIAKLKEASARAEPLTTNTIASFIRTNTPAINRTELEQLYIKTFEPKRTDWTHFDEPHEIQELRRLTSALRPLDPSDAARDVRTLPPGVWFYAAFPTIVKLLSGSREPAPPNPKFFFRFLVLKAANSDLSLIGFVERDAATRLSYLDGHTRVKARISPWHSDEKNSLLVLPFKRIYETPEFSSYELQRLIFASTTNLSEFSIDMTVR